MVALAMALSNFIMGAYIFIFVGLLIYIIWYFIKKDHRKTMISGGIFVALCVFMAFILYNAYRDKRNAAQQFLGDYKVKYLDGEPCRNCRITLKEGYIYDIVIDDNVIGHGNWIVGRPIQITQAFLIIEGSDADAIWQDEDVRTIEYLDRRLEGLKEDNIN